MGAVRLILLGAALAAFILFAIPNWQPATVHFGATDIVTPLPLLVLLAFLAGALPMYLAHRVARGRWSRRLARAEAPLAPMAVPPMMTSEAQPTVVPPGYG